MILSKELRPVQSTKLYTQKAVDMNKDFSIGPGKYQSILLTHTHKHMHIQYHDKNYLLYIFYLDFPPLKQAASAQQYASRHPYTKEYKKQIVGNRPQDPSIGYPEHDHHKKVGEYMKPVKPISKIYIDTNSKVLLFFNL